MYPERRQPKSPWKNRSSLAILFLGAFWGGIGASCNFPSEKATRNPPYIDSEKEFLPLEGNQKTSKYLIDGTATDYQLKIVKDGTKVSFQAVSNDLVVDEEVYDMKDGQVLLCHAVGEDFVPPVPLLKFPLSLGDAYDWKGKLVCNDLQLKGAAKIATSTDYVAMKDKSQEAVKVEVSLKIDSNASRKLSFWFVKGMGVLKTEMGKNVREPKF